MAPKFPSAHNLLFLLRYWQKTGNEQAKEMVRQTLKAMRRGGIFDQLGYGFHRYSTDRKWRLPHFEKMLYDQALLIMAYSEAYQCFGDPDFAETARQTIAYAMRSLRAPQGGFFSAEDADSEGEEGKFYTWRTEEIRPDSGRKIGSPRHCLFFHAKRGQFRGGTQRRDGRGPMCFSARPPSKNWPPNSTPDEAALREEIGRIKSALFEQRRKRPAPVAGRQDTDRLERFDDRGPGKGQPHSRIPQSYAEAATAAADFILRHSRYRQLLSHCYCKEKVAGTGFLDDYAFFAWGLYEVYQTTFEDRFLAEALRLTREMARDFGDAATGGLFFSRPDSAELFRHPEGNGRRRLFFRGQRGAFPFAAFCRAHQ